MDLSRVHSLVIGGGGMNGFGFLGALNVVYSSPSFALGKNLHTLAGSSVGAGIAFMLCMGYSPKCIFEVMSRVDFGTMTEGIGADNLFHALDKKGLTEPTPFMRVIRTFAKHRGIREDCTFAELYEALGSRMRLFITGTSLRTQRITTFSVLTHPHMSVMTAVRISISIPFIFCPVFYDGQYFIDGAHTQSCYAEVLRMPRPLDTESVQSSRDAPLQNSASPSDHVEMSPGDAVEMSPGDRVEISPSDAVEISPGDAVEMSPGDRVEISPSDPVEMSPGDPVEMSPGDPVEMSPGNPVEMSPGNPVEISIGDPVENGDTTACSILPAAIIIDSVLGGEPADGSWLTRPRGEMDAGEFATAVLYSYIRSHHEWGAACTAQIARECNAIEVRVPASSADTANFSMDSETKYALFKRGVSTAESALQM